MIARHRIYLGLGALAVAAALAWAFAPRPMQVEAATVTVGRFETAVEEDAKTRLKDTYLVSAPLAGLVRRIGLREGDPVAAGAVVASMRPAHAPLLDERSRRELQARLGAAQAQSRSAAAAVERAGIAWLRAARDFARSEQLAREGFVSASARDSEHLAMLAANKDYASARSQHQAALFDVSRARAALAAGDNAGQADFPVRAPVAGTVLRVVQSSEAVVALGAPLLELGDPGALELVAELLSADALRTPPGSAVRIDRWGGPVLQGRVRRIEPAAFTKISALGVEEQRVRVLIDLLEPPARLRGLGVAYRVNVHIVTTSAERVRKVPVSALFPIPGTSGEADGPMAVYLVREGRARLARVRLGGRNDREAWVTDGLAEGAQVIVYPSAQVHDGARVAVRDVARQF